MTSTIRRQAGFTLLELMIVVAVVAVLAMIGLPLYGEQIRKGKRAEAAQALGDLQLRQEGWRADHPLYGSMDDLTGSAGATTAFNTALKNYTVAVSGNNATAYTITATRKGDLASDPKCGNFTLAMNAGVVTKGVSAGDAAYCWRQ
jgi:type IV pilus assembly protein PilE